MLALDPRTIVLLLAVISVSQALTLALFSRLVASRYPGVGVWVWSSVVNAVGFVLMLLRGGIPDLLSVIVGNAALIGAVCLSLRGVNQFLGRPRPAQERLALALLALSVAALVPLTYGMPSVSWRTVVVGLALGAISELCAWSLLRSTPAAPPISYRFTAAVFGLNGLWHLARAGLAAAGGPVADLFSPTASQTLAFLVGVAALLLWVAGVVAMFTQRLLGDLRAAQAAERAALEESARRLAEDITARRATEEQLRQSRTQLELALWGAELGLWDWHIPSGTMQTNPQLAHLIGLEPRQLTPVVAIWKLHTHPDDLPGVEAAFDAAIAGRAARIDLEFRIRHRDGSWRWHSARGRAIEHDAIGRAGRLIGITRDITARKQAEALLRRRLAELVALNQIALALTTWTNVVEGLGAVAGLLRQLFSAGAVAVWEYEHTAGRLRGLLPGAGELSLAAAELGPEVLDRQAASMIALAGDHPLLGGQGDRSAAPRRALLLPLRARNALVGLLCLAAGDPDQIYTPDDLALAQTVGGVLASALDNARLFAQAQEAAAEQERRRLARELHDSVSQALFAANRTAEMLPQLWELDPDEGHAALADLQRFTAAALAEMRTLLIELRPRALVETPLHETLSLLAPTAITRGVGRVTASFAPAPLLPPDVQVGLYRIAQEALNNVGKHARARHVRVELEVAPQIEPGRAWQGEVTISVADDGRGFAPEQGRPGHLGLVTMRERAADMGATLKVTSRPGAGSSVRVSWRGAAQPEQETVAQ